MTVCGRISSAKPDTQSQDLLDRLNEYYQLEKDTNWEKTYTFRTPLYQKSIPFKIYKDEMMHDNKGWKLIDFKIFESKIEGNYAAFRIKFIEQVPIGYFLNSSKKLIKTVHVSTWEKINGIWFCRDACSRTHLSMNSDAVVRNDQKPIDLIPLIPKE